MQFSASPKDKHPKAFTVISELVRDVRQHSDKLVPRLIFVQHRLAIGWGTLRVGIGMAIGSKLYEVCHTRFDDNDDGNI